LILLIVAALDAVALRKLLAYTHELGMTAMVEINNADEATLAVEAGAQFIGINNRNLRTFEVDRSTTARLRPLIPSSIVVAALSGLRSVGDAMAMRQAGADAVLVGEALVRSADPAALISAMGDVA
jgi:indole-3-glycerol phosphate synthase